MTNPWEMLGLRKNVVDQEKFNTLLQDVEFKKLVDDMYSAAGPTFGTESEGSLQIDPANFDELEPSFVEMDSEEYSDASKAVQKWLDNKGMKNTMESIWSAVQSAETDHSDVEG